MIALGLALALAVVFLFPTTFGPREQVVSVIEQAPPAEAIERTSYADAVARAAPAVVNLYTSKSVMEEAHPLYDDPLFNPFFRDPVYGPSLGKQTSLGSGVIISPQGYILTNNHVVADAEQIEVILPDHTRLEARVIGSDPETDIAVLKANARNLPAIVIRDTEDLKVGDVVLAIGNPFGVGQTVTQGIISATGRNQVGLNTFEDFIQTDAAINPGSSGGALIDAYGKLVGINTAIYSRSGSTGIGFAIPVNLARDVMTQIIEHGRVVRGWLGVEGANLPASLVESLGLPDSSGVIITKVFEDGPGAQAELESNDILLEIDGKAIIGVKDALNTIARSQPGATLEIRGLRNGEAFTTFIDVSVRPTARKALTPEPMDTHTR